MVTIGTCAKCGGTFPSKSLSLHKAFPSKQYICPDCKYGRRKEVIKCEYCGKAKCLCKNESSLQRHNTSGYTGVRKKYKDGRSMPWVAEVTVEGKRRSIGSFHSAEEAHKARCEYLRGGMI